MNDEIDPDIEGDSDEAAAPLICDVKILLDGLIACNIMKSSNRAIRRGVRCTAHTLPLAVDDALKQTALRECIVKAQSAYHILRNPSTVVVIRKDLEPLVQSILPTQVITSIIRFINRCLSTYFNCPFRCMELCGVCKSFVRLGHHGDRFL